MRRVGTCRLPSFLASVQRLRLGFKSDVTLTGFKWMGNKADELRANGKHVILAWEESIGYMPGHTMDKVINGFSCKNWDYLSLQGRF